MATIEVIWDRLGMKIKHGWATTSFQAFFLLFQASEVCFSKK